jgi:hypothetical protein
MGAELTDLFADIGRDEIAIDELYTAAERRFGPLLDRSPDPARLTQEKWQHDLRWEIQSAVLDGRIIKRDDVGRGVYSLPGGRLSRRLQWDLVFTVPAGQDISRWTTFSEIYVPGTGRPRGVVAGSHLWLRHRQSLVWRCDVESVEHRTSRHSTMDGTEHGPGWSICVANGEPSDLGDDAIGFTGGRWGQGVRYLDPVSLRLKGAVAEPPRLTTVRFAAVERVSAQLVIARTSRVVTQWNRVESRLLSLWIAWCASAGRVVTRPVIRTEEGATIIGDAFDETRGLLVEAKGSSSREHVRMAIGQILDYSSLMTDVDHRRAILLPARPPSSMVRLLAGLGIGLVYRTGDGFVELVEAAVG